MTLRRFLNLSNFPPGILPAHAGSTGVNTAGAGFSGDHPRVCGEHVDGFLRRLALLESSPRMRRAPGSCHERTAPTGIIPAYAGSTPASTETRKTCRDHPRVCGEHWAGHKAVNRSVESSPRMRGAPPLVSCEDEARGIIPAYAGNTPATRSGSAPRRRGSSPRMRGARRRVPRRERRAGIIPAYAGSTGPVTKP